MVELSPVGIFTAVTSVISLVINLFIIYICYKIRNKAKDIIYVVVLCLADLLSPIIAISEIIFGAITQARTVDQAQTCQIIGALVISHPLIVTVFAVALAFKRLTHVVNLDYNKLYWNGPLALILTLHVVLMGLVANHYELMKAPSNIHCQIYPSTSTLSAIVFYFLAACVMVGAILVIYCYTRIALFAANTSNAIMLEDRPSLSVLDPDRNSKFTKPKLRQTIQNQFHISAIRIWLIVTLYATFMIPGTILYLIEGTISRDDEQKAYTKYILSSLAMVLFFTGTLMNPILAVFLHTGILATIKKFFRINNDRSTHLNC